MNDATIVCAVLITALELLLVALACFLIGFFIGHQREERKIIKKVTAQTESKIKEEEKTEKQWKKFLNYDGSVKSDNNMI